jgi:hypothetical protein
MGLNEDCRKVHIGEHLFNEFHIQNGLKSLDAFITIFLQLYF